MDDDQSLHCFILKHNSNKKWNSCVSVQMRFLKQSPLYNVRTPEFDVMLYMYDLNTDTVYSYVYMKDCTYWRDSMHICIKFMRPAIHDPNPKPRQDDFTFEQAEEKPNVWNSGFLWFAVLSDAHVKQQLLELLGTVFRCHHVITCIVDITLVVGNSCSNEYLWAIMITEESYQIKNTLLLNKMKTRKHKKETLIFFLEDFSISQHFASVLINLLYFAWQTKRLTGSQR